MMYQASENLLIKDQTFENSKQLRRIRNTFLKIPFLNIRNKRSLSNIFHQ